MVNRYVFYSDGTIRMHNNIAHERGIDLSLDLSQIEIDYDIGMASVLRTAQNGPRKLHIVGEEEQEGEEPNVNADTFLYMFSSENRPLGMSRCLTPLRGTIVMYEDVMHPLSRRVSETRLLPLRMLTRTRPPVRSMRYRPIASDPRMC